jgi:hypothetical protein
MFDRHRFVEGQYWRLQGSRLWLAPHPKLGIKPVAVHLTSVDPARKLQLLGAYGLWSACCFEKARLNYSVDAVLDSKYLAMELEQESSKCKYYIWAASSLA